MERSQHNLELLALAEAVAGAVMAAVAVIVLFWLPNLLKNNALTIVSGGIGLAGFLYHFSAHQVLKKQKLNLSVLISTAIVAANLALLIIQTGSLDSAFYSFWLLVVLVFGIIGVGYIYAAAAFSLIFFLASPGAMSNPGRYLLTHAGQLLATALSTVVAHWVHVRWAQVSQITQHAASRVGEEQFKAMALMNSINEAVMVVDADRRIQFFNPAAVALSGWERDNAIGLDYNSVLKLRNAEDQELDAAHDPFAESWKSSGAVIKNNLILITKSDRRKTISMSISPLFDINRRVQGAIALFRDVSMEQEVDRQRSEFISTASHEMRTPIAALEGYISLSLNPAVATVDTRARGYLEKAHNTIQHLGQLFKDLLTSAKMEEGQLKEKLEPVELGQLLQEITDNLRFVASKKSLSVVYQPSSLGGHQPVTPLYYVKANPERIREVVTNLTDNAIKYTQAGGVSVSITGDNDFVTVSVRDTGMGIAPEDVPHLFQKFYRVDNSATRTTGGTGLGLYLCRHIIENYQGRIWVESTPGRGTVFSFSLPRLRNDQVKAAAEAAISQTPPAPLAGVVK